MLAVRKGHVDSRTHIHLAAEQLLDRLFGLDLHFCFAVIILDGFPGVFFVQGINKRRPFCIIQPGETVCLLDQLSFSHHPVGYIHIRHRTYGHKRRNCQYCCHHSCHNLRVSHIIGYYLHLKYYIVRSCGCCSVFDVLSPLRASGIRPLVHCLCAQGFFPPGRHLEKARRQMPEQPLNPQLLSFYDKSLIFFLTGYIVSCVRR